MKCKLCQRDVELRKSHVIPEFLYKPLYDSKNRFHVLGTTKHRPRPLEQKGIRERLLCDDCEGSLSKWETYARGVLFGGVEIVCSDFDAYFEVSGIDYEKFKLFQMSILWRAGVASDNFFARVQLGPHEEQLRNMILSRNPGSEEEYPCIMFQLLDKNKVVKDFIDQPTKLRIEGRISYRFIFGGVIWMYKVLSHRVKNAPPMIQLSESGKINIYRGRLQDLGYLREFASDIQELNRMPNSKNDV